MLVRNRILVFVQKVLGFVLYVQGIVSNRKRVVRETRFLEIVLVVGGVKVAVKLLHKALVGTGGKTRFLNVY